MRDITSTALAEEIVMLEAALNNREKTRDGRGFEDLLSPDFYEFGTSGRVWSRDAITAMLKDSPKSEGAMTDVRVTQLADASLLLTYRSRRAASTLRSSVWSQINGTWQMVFHQGTVVPSAPLSN